MLPLQGSAQKFLSGGLKLTQTDVLCVILGYIAHVSVIYVRIVLVGFKRVFRGTGHFGPLPTSVGRTLPLVA